MVTTKCVGLDWPLSGVLHTLRALQSRMHQYDLLGCQKLLEMHKDFHCRPVHCRTMCGTERNACTLEAKIQTLVLQTQMELSAAQQHVQQLTQDLELKSTQMEQLLEHANSLDAEHIAHIQEAEEDLAALSEVSPAGLQSLHKPSEHVLNQKG